METLPVIAQLRATVFISQFIGYSPQNENEYRALFLPDGTLTPIQPEGLVPSPQAPVIPQYGMPWRLIKWGDKQGESTSVTFYPGKIDIILNKEGHLEELGGPFIDFCIGKFKLLLAKSFVISRMAFCPTFTIRVDSSEQATEYWRRLLKCTTSNGIRYQNIGVNYLLKTEIIVNQRTVVMNFLHQITDGVHITSGTKDADCILVTLDMNSAPEHVYSFVEQDLAPFFEQCKEWSRRLMENVF